MLFIYPAIFHKENGSYRAEFPDLEGYQAAGDTLNQTMESAQEALSSYLLTLLEGTTPIPQPSDLSVIEHDTDSFATLVTCNINQYKDTKAVKKTLTIPSWLNDRAVSMGINFSQVLQEALITKIQTK